MLAEYSALCKTEMTTFMPTCLPITRKPVGKHDLSHPRACLHSEPRV